MKEVLEYTEEELRALSKDELKLLLKRAKDGESLFNTRQLVEKTLINALYGALANKYFPLFNEQMAAAITGNGRYFIRKLSNNIEAKLQELLPQDNPYVLYNDTDSGYYHIAPFMERYQEQNPGLSMSEYVDWADSFEKKIIQPVIQETIDDFARELNAYNKDKIGAEREIIADAAVFTAKKKYYARVRDSEGTRYPDETPKIKVMGLEIIKSGTPNWSKKYLKEAINHILDKDEKDLRAWLKEIKQDYVKTPIKNLPAIAGVSSLDYVLGQKGLHIGPRSALVHNKYIKDNNLDDKYEPIVGGDKTKRLYLIEPNKFNSNIIAYTNDLFTNEIKGFIDYDKNFEKTFLNPLMLMVRSLGYNLLQETQTLDDW